MGGIVIAAHRRRLAYEAARLQERPLYSAIAVCLVAALVAIFAA